MRRNALLKPVLATATAMLALSIAPAQAALVTCGDAALGVRVSVVDPGLAGGYCYAQQGNLKNSDIAALGLTQLGKEVVAAGDVASSLLDFTADSARTSGTWSIAAAPWTSWTHLYLGLHFGNGTSAADSSPDSFIVELSRPDPHGTWALSGTATYKANGLSNLYLLASDSCTSCGRLPPNSVPEPAPLGLLAAAAMAALLTRRKA